MATQPLGEGEGDLQESATGVKWGQRPSLGKVGGTGWPVLQWQVRSDASVLCSKVGFRCSPVLLACTNLHSYTDRGAAGPTGPMCI